MTILRNYDYTYWLVPGNHRPRSHQVLCGIDFWAIHSIGPFYQYLPAHNEYLRRLQKNPPHDLTQALSNSQAVIRSMIKDHPHSEFTPEYLSYRGDIYWNLLEKGGTSELVPGRKLIAYLNRGRHAQIFQTTFEGPIPNSYEWCTVRIVSVLQAGLPNHQTTKLNQVGSLLPIYLGDLFYQDP